MTEGQEQSEAVKWFRATYPEHAQALRVSGNVIPRTGKRAAQSYARHKAMGGVKGESDLAILIPRGEFGCLLIEHKGADQPRKLTAEQLEYLEYHRSVGNCVASTRGLEALKAALATYMALPLREPQQRQTELPLSA